MGCVGKILGWAIAIVGFAAAIFTVGDIIGTGCRRVGIDGW